jgi:hypothetical protein
MEGPKLSSFKIVEPLPQNDKNMSTKTAIKPIFSLKISICVIVNKKNY